MKMRSLLFAGAVFFATSAGWADERSKQGALLFEQSGCSHCHAIRHIGGTKGPDLSGIGRTLTKAQIRLRIVQGGAQMPPFGDSLDERELTTLMNYLHSCRDKTKQSAPSGQ